MSHSAVGRGSEAEIALVAKNLDVRIAALLDFTEDVADTGVGRVEYRDDDVDAMRRLCSDHAVRIRVHNRLARIHGSFSHQPPLARYAMIRSCASISFCKRSRCAPSDSN